MCDGKSCGDCEIFYSNPLGCPKIFESRMTQAACEHFVPKRQGISRAYACRRLGNDQFARLFALIASCEGCFARSKECSPETGTDFGTCRRAWADFLDAESDSEELLQTLCKRTKKEMIRTDIEDLVLPFAQARILPACSFRNTAFVYAKTDSPDLDFIPLPRKKLKNGPGVVAAPSVQEILAELASFTDYPSVTWRNSRDWVAGCSFGPFCVFEAIADDLRMALFRLYIKAWEYKKEEKI